MTEEEKRTFFDGVVNEVEDAISDACVIVIALTDVGTLRYCSNLSREDARERLQALIDDFTTEKNMKLN